MPSIVFPRAWKARVYIWNDPVGAERTRPLERRWPKERLERLVQSEQQPQGLRQLLVLVLVLVQPWLGLPALEEQWWSFRRFRH